MATVSPLTSIVATVPRQSAEKNEAVNAAIKQKFGTFVRLPLWWKQFRELVIKCVVHNL